MSVNRSTHILNLNKMDDLYFKQKCILETYLMSYIINFSAVKLAAHTYEYVFNAFGNQFTNEILCSMSWLFIQFQL